MRPVLVASVPTALSYRNVVFSGLADRLAAHYRLVIAGTAAARPDWQESNLPASEFWELESARSTRGHELFFSSLQRAFFNRYQVNTWDMINRYRHRDKSKAFRQRLRQ